MKKKQWYIKFSHRRKPKSWAFVTGLITDEDIELHMQRMQLALYNLCPDVTFSATPVIDMRDLPAGMYVVTDSLAFRDTADSVERALMSDEVRTK